jgi:hypothetical protein
LETGLSHDEEGRALYRCELLMSDRAQLDSLITAKASEEHFAIYSKEDVASAEEEGDDEDEEADEVAFAAYFIGERWVV